MLKIASDNFLNFKGVDQLAWINEIWSAVILLPVHPASFAHKLLFQQIPGCKIIADLSLKIVFWTHKVAVGTH